jgi:hypothetical protein
MQEGAHCANFVLLGSFLLICPVGDTTANQTKQANTSTVHIIPVDIYGTELRLEGTVKSFDTESDGPDLAAMFHRNAATGIAYGTYKMRFYADGFYSVEREVRVFQPEVWSVVALTLGNEGGPQTSSVSGKILNTGPSVSNIRIRLSGVYSGDIMDAVVDNSGSFALTKGPNGVYSLVATEDDKILDVRTIKVPTTGPVVIDLEQTSIIR